MDVRSGVGISDVDKTVVLIEVRDGEAADGVDGAGGVSVGTSAVGGGTTGGAVGISGVTITSESLNTVVPTSSGDGVIDGVADGGAWVTAMKGDVGGGAVGLVVKTAPEKEIFQSFKNRCNNIYIKYICNRLS